MHFTQDYTHWSVIPRSLIRRYECSNACCIHAYIFYTGKHNTLCTWFICDLLVASALMHTHRHVNALLLCTHLYKQALVIHASGSYG